MSGGFGRALLKLVCLSLGVFTLRDCEEVRRDLYRSLDEDLPPGRRRLLRLHLYLCRPCYSRREFARLIKLATRESITRVKAPRRLKNRLKLESFPEPKTPAD